MESKKTSTIPQNYEARHAYLDGLRCLCTQIRHTMNESFSDVCPGRGDRMADFIASEIEETDRDLMYLEQKNAMKGGAR